MPTIDQVYAEKYKRGLFSDQAKAAYEVAVQRGIYQAPKEMIDAPLLGPSPEQIKTDEMAAQSAAVRKQVMDEMLGFAEGVESPKATGLAQSAEQARVESGLAPLPVGPNSQQALLEKGMLPTQTANMTPERAFMVGTGKGMADIGRGVGDIIGMGTDGASPQEQQAMGRLKEEMPIATGVGEITGQVAPFIPAALAAEMAAGYMGVTGAKGLLTRAALNAPIGALEGAALAEDKTKGAVVGAGIEIGAEVLFPVIGRIASKVFRRVMGKPPVGAMLDIAGNPTPELNQALEKVGINFEDLAVDAQELITKQATGSDTGQVARKALFEEENVPITRGTMTQDPAILAKEGELISDVESSAASQYRNIKLEQSEAIKKSLLDNFPTEYTNTETGQLLQGALEGKYNLMSTESRRLYKEAAEQAENVGGIPIITQNISDAVPDAKLRRRIDTIKGSQVEGLESLLVEFGISDDPKLIKKFINSGGEIDPLNISNFEDFRQALGALESADQSRSTSVLIKPIRDALDSELDNLGVALEEAGVAPNVIEPFKEARASYRQKKVEYSDKSLAKALIAKGKDSVDQMVEASKIYSDKIASKAVPVERVRKLMKTLKGAGAEGELSLEALRTTTMLDLVNAGFGTKSKIIGAEQVFNPIAFRNRIESIGKEKVNAIFAGHGKVLKNLNNIEQIAKELTVSSDLMPKGSAASPMFIKLMNRLGAVSLGAKVPIIGPMLIDSAAKSSQAVKSGQNLKTITDLAPDVERMNTYLERTFPGIASAMGISLLTEGDQ